MVLMQRDSKTPTSSSDRSETAELDALRGLCSQQSVRIAELEDAATRQRAQSQELARQNDQLSRRLSPSTRPLVEVAFAADHHAPGAARDAVARALGGGVALAAVSDAQLVVSELVTNRVHASGAPSSDSITVRVSRNLASARVEVAAAGPEGGLAVTPTNGLGLRLVEAVSECWGVEWASSSGTQMWAQIVIV
ncbi:MAG TPA: ATP-binding protein [Solirubrobacter sp.]|nr:ATP-binding protein [Solirubrobacter sp.]